ncbi:hypothetical protein F4778DRAFT_731835, partial [Xylariomycetidae sp. FL2044]
MHTADEQGLLWNGIPKGIKSFSEYEAKIEAGEDTSLKEGIIHRLCKEQSPKESAHAHSYSRTMMKQQVDRVEMAKRRESYSLRWEQHLLVKKLIMQTAP